MALTLTLSVSSAAHAVPRWAGACGSGIPDSNPLERYPASPQINYSLLCGNASFGWRHIVARHRDDFRRVVVDTGQNWLDVADRTMAGLSRDPDVVTTEADGKLCVSRVVFLRNTQTNQIVRQQVMRMIIRVSDYAIITAYPHRNQCHIN